jgi:phosphoenolpyruvate synthase/pyruvate phosphate dikinase
VGIVAVFARSRPHLGGGLQSFSSQRMFKVLLTITLPERNQLLRSDAFASRGKGGEEVTLNIVWPEIIFEGKGKRGLLGGKASRLIQLANSHFPVPSFFVITTDAFNEFISGIDEYDEIKDSIYSRDLSPERLSDIHNSIMKRFVETGFPPIIEEGICDAIQKLIEEERLSVAVRSSAIAEDIEDASFAGLHDTFLNIQTVEGVLKAVKRCWASLFTPRATSYRNRLDLGQYDLGMAVIVQKMVNAQTSGVLFTTHPVTRRSDRMLIESSWGLGEALVQGQVTPDVSIVDKRSMSIIEKTISPYKNL